MINHGVIPGTLPGNWIGGTIPWVNRNPSANWYPYLVHGEKQYFSNFDTMACVSFATNNVCEIQIKHQTGVEIDDSDRFLAKISNTTPEGNYVSTVLDARKNAGIVREVTWPKPAEPTSWAAYYSDIPQAIKNQALGIKALYDLQYEYNADLRPESIRHELQHAPLLITIPGHEVTAIAISDDGKTLTVLDDYIFNVDPMQPFVRTIKLSDVTALYKAVLTVKGNPMNLINQNGTYFLAGEKGKLGIADPESLALLKQLTDVEQLGVTAVPQVGIIEKGFTIHK